MSAMTPDQLREAFLAFYEGHGHSRYPSDSLVPEDDPTLLFTGAGMNQFKAMFMGKGHLPFTRATTSQKCMRMPDLENVGRTASHHTFFEMLGNFSFGDYFKEDAIRWAWEFLGRLGVPPERLSVTVFQDDDEAAQLWTDVAGVPPARIFREGEAENFWPASAPSKGPNGICGPCSEIYFDLYPERGPMPPVGPTQDGGRFVEIWNLVFTQFNRKDGGALEPLPQRNIDTGMGFERTVRVVESLAAGRTLESNFETTLFAPLMQAIHSHVGHATSFGTPEGIHARRIADHVRAAVFGISDGVRPSNLKQGYVIRKVLRRAMIDRHRLGADLRKPWLGKLADIVIDTMGGQYPALREGRGVITATITGEEEKFTSTFLAASNRLVDVVKTTCDRGEHVLSGSDAFLLYDTFGLPLDLQRLLLEEHHFGVDEDGYHAAMAAQRRRSREASKISDDIMGGLIAALGSPLKQTEFVREALEVSDANILDCVVESDEGAETSVLVVLDRTPFYAEGGGQVGDTGVLVGDGFKVAVEDTVSAQGIHIHRGLVVEGEVRRGPCTARVDGGARDATARNHTATHLLHAALRSVLGEEVTQAGSLVTPERLRFDFRFARGMTPEELTAVEDLVNAWVLSNEPVGAEVMGRDAAREAGAMALFGEKYGETVRVVRVPNREGGDSVELCGGTHVSRSGDIGLLRIVSEGSIAAGIRRIEARTGLGLIEHAREQSDALARSAALFKASPEQLAERITTTQSELKELRKALDVARGQLAAARLDGAIRDWNGLRILATVVEGVPLKQLRDVASRYLESGCDLVLLAVPDGEGVSYLAAAGSAAQERGARADALVRALAEALGGKGGGNASLAQGRGVRGADLPDVLEAVLEGAAAPSS